MAFITYPLNNIDYTAEDAELFHCTRTSGIWAEDSFSISVTGADNNVTIGTGIAWINNKEFSGKVAALKSAEVLDLGIADGTYPRIDVIAIQFNTNNNATDVVIKKGTPATNPVQPAIVRSGAVYELYLASVYRPAGATVITASNVTDLRMDETVCGLMADSVTHIDTKAINRQVQELLDVLYKSIAEAGAATDIVLKSAIYPVGSLYVTSTPENPATYLGGTWELYDKHLKTNYLSTEKGDRLVATRYTVNASSCDVYLTAHDHTAEIRVDVTLAKSMDATNLEFAELNFRSMGFHKIRNTVYSVGAADAAGGIAAMELSYDTGLVTGYDVFPKGTKTTLPSGSKVRGVFTCTVDSKWMLNDFCDKFFWKKTSLHDDAEQIVE